MVLFPETARLEWEAAAASAHIATVVKKNLDRAVAVENALERLRVRHEANILFQQELDADSTPVLEMSTLTDYRGNPAAAPTDLVSGVLKEDGLCVVLGPAGSGKSTAALQMLHSLMSGEDWLGQPVTQLSGGVGVLSYDMDAAMVFDWMDGFPNIDPAKVSVVNAYKRGNPLGVPAMRKQIVDMWKALNVEVIVLDSFSASFFLQDQNDAGATMAHYRDLKLFALTEVGAKALIVIAHSTKAKPGQARGSTVHQDVADSMVSVESDDAGERTISMVKYRAARGQHAMTPVVVTQPDAKTHLLDLDLGAMSLKNYPIPATITAKASFTALPIASPDTDSYDETEDDDL